ncbi:MAG: hypothetical protein ACRYF4_07775 [Janthinobacterium lividum]
MTFQSLADLFHQYDVPEGAYSLGDDMNVGDCWVLLKENDSWHVYFSERGQREREQVFLDEDSACTFMLQRVATSLWYSKRRKMPGLPSNIGD